MPVSAAPFTSAHFNGAYAAELRVSPAARDAYLTLVADTEFAQGTRFVELLREPRSQRSAGALSLTRGVHGWRFARTEADGSAAPEDALGFCAQCHALAPAPPVFGPPRSRAAAPDAATRNPSELTPREQR